MSDRTAEALRLFDEGFNCAQSVLAALAPEGLPREVALRVACGFGGGLGRMGETCGAVSGAVMALGLAHGNVSATDAEAKARTYEKVRALLREFRARHGSIRCGELLGVGVGSPEALQQAHDQGLTRQVCPRFLRDAVELVEGLR